LAVRRAPLPVVHEAAICLVANSGLDWPVCGLLYVYDLPVACTEKQLFI